jgi:TetR/AcrR family transcriptional repressor of mexJK operon
MEIEADPMDSTLLLDHENASRILEEGWRLFQQKGYRGVTMDELCQRCGVTKPTLYYYFHDKETLFVQVLQHKLRGFHQVMEREGSLAQRLQAVAASILESFQSEYTALLRDREHIKDREHLVSIRNAFHSELFDPLKFLMQSGIESGELAGSNPDLLSLVFLGIINNFIGRSVAMEMENTDLAGVLTRYFLEGTLRRE